jgi:hypothetical protein
MSFKAINWTPNELMGETKTDQLADNAEWLYQNTPRAIYTLPGGLRRVEGVKIASGRVLIAKRTKADSATASVRFGNFFSTRCQPIITTGIVAEHQTKIFATISGIGMLQPDHRGFSVGVNIAAESKKNDKIARSFYVTWQAMGY